MRSRARSVRYFRSRSQLTRCCQSSPAIPKLAPMCAVSPRKVIDGAIEREEGVAAWTWPKSGAKADSRHQLHGATLRTAIHEGRVPRPESGDVSERQRMNEPQVGQQRLLGGLDYARQEYNDAPLTDELQSRR